MCLALLVTNSSSCWTQCCKETSYLAGTKFIFYLSKCKSTYLDMTQYFDCCFSTALSIQNHSTYSWNSHWRVAEEEEAGEGVHTRGHINQCSVSLRMASELANMKSCGRLWESVIMMLQYTMRMPPNCTLSIDNIKFGYIYKSFRITARMSIQIKMLTGLKNKSFFYFGGEMTV